MELYIFKVGSRYWIFKKSSKLNKVLTKPGFWLVVAVVVVLILIIT